jgi:hypothetical protein
VRRAHHFPRSSILATALCTAIAVALFLTGRHMLAGFAGFAAFFICLHIGD